MNVQGKNIIITGGSLGIGKETARTLVQKGANVLITGRSESRLIEAKHYTGAKIIEFDISDHENISENAVECIDILEGRVDALINNAGINKINEFCKISGLEFLEIHHINAYAPFEISKSIVIN